MILILAKCMGLESDVAIPQLYTRV